MIFTTTTTTTNDDQVLAKGGKSGVLFRATCLIYIGPRRFHAKIKLLMFKDTIFAALHKELVEDLEPLLGLIKRFSVF